MILFVQSQNGQVTIRFKMKFNPKIHHRNSIRLKDFDYSSQEYYFITICARNRECIFGEIIDNQPKLIQLGQIIKHEWLALPRRFPQIELDEYIIMPNHFHAIIQILGVFSSASVWADVKPAPTLGDIICAFKLVVFKRYYDLIRQNNVDEIAKCWQRNYWERIIRDNQEFINIQHYIATNPERWSEDSDNLDRLLIRMTERHDA
ncbi:transposase [Runella sp.]|uniref:transposase n=1 Tax=Runella sp. TaxID=1960881 RepID=UPI003D14E2D6